MPRSSSSIGNENENRWIYPLQLLYGPTVDRTDGRPLGEWGHNDYSNTGRDCWEVKKRKDAATAILLGVRQARANARKTGKLWYYGFTPKGEKFLHSLVITDLETHLIRNGIDPKKVKL